jgi:hypothetical protein
MTEEFITVYIDRMKTMLTDLQSRVLFLETDSHFKAKAIEALTIENEQLKAALDKAGKRQPKKVDIEGF